MLDKNKKNLEVCFLTDLEGGRGWGTRKQYIHTLLTYKKSKYNTLQLIFSPKTQPSHSDHTPMPLP